MTVTLDPETGTQRDLLAQSEGGGGAVGLAVAEDMVPAHLLDGDETVLFAIKPSAWFILLSSLRWLGVAAVLMVLSASNLVTPTYRMYLLQLAILIAGSRLIWSTLEWVSRLYVLTNRRVMSMRGVTSVEMFECHLDRIQHTELIITPAERLARVGSVAFETAGGRRGRGTWQTVAKPLEVHEKLRNAMRRSHHRGSHEV